MYYLVFFGSIYPYRFIAIRKALVSIMFFCRAKERKTSQRVQCCHCKQMLFIDRFIASLVRIKLLGRRRQWFLDECEDCLSVVAGWLRPPPAALALKLCK